MTFALTPAAPFTAGVSTISAATANAWRTAISQSLDTVNGGAYVNVTSIDWSAGSAGWRFYAAVAIKSTGTLTLDAGATVTINADPSLFGTMRVGVGSAGGGVRFYATSTLQVDDTVAVSFAGDLTMTGASTAVHASASTDTYAAGSLLTINTALATVGAGAVFTANGVLGNVAQIVCGQYSTVTCQSGSGLTCNSGALFTVANGCVATVTFGASSTLTIASSGNASLASGSTTTLVSGCIFTGTIGGGGAVSTLTFGADANLVFASSSDIAHNSGSLSTFGNLSTLTMSAGSVFNQGGDTTRTGKTIRSGANAWELIRQTNGNSADTTYSGQEYDIINAIGNAGLNITYTLSNTGASEVVSTMIIHNGNGFNLIIKNTSGTTIYTFTNGAGTKKAVQFWCTGGANWNVGMVGETL